MTKCADLWPGVHAAIAKAQALALRVLADRLEHGEAAAELLTIRRRCAGKVALTDLIPNLEVEYNQHVDVKSGAVRCK
jgi:hypothetical protein